MTSELRNIIKTAIGTFIKLLRNQVTSALSLVTISEILASVFSFPISVMFNLEI